MAAPGTMGQGTLLQRLSDPKTQQDPYPIYRLLRREQPVLWVPPGLWVVSRWKDCDAVLRDRRFGSVDPKSWHVELGRGKPTEEADWVHDRLRRTMAFAPEDRHAELRDLVGWAFTPKHTATMAERVAKVAQSLVEEAVELGTVDFVADVASRVPLHTLAELLGIPDRLEDEFRGWVRTISPLLDPTLSEEAAGRAVKTFGEFAPVLQAIMLHRKARPREDLMTQLMRAHEGGRLDDEDLASNAGFLIVAGTETVTNALGNAVHTFLDHPDEWQRIVDDPSLIPSAVEETLRYESAVQMISRRALEDVSVGGQTIRKGQRVVLLVGAANRDPERFDEPDRFDVTRNRRDHLTFSGGARYCLGAPLARAEMTTVFEALSRRAPDLRRGKGEVRWLAQYTFRGLEHLPVTLRP